MITSTDQPVVETAVADAQAVHNATSSQHHAEGQPEKFDDMSRARVAIILLR